MEHELLFVGVDHAATLIAVESDLEVALAKKGVAQNGSRLEEAMAMLIQNQAAFLSRAADTDSRLAQIERETSERFKRIENDMTAILRMLSEHGRVLSEHSRMLEHLPDAVRERIGFKREG